MLEDYFLKPKTLDRIRESWIAASIEKSRSRRTYAPRFDFTEDFFKFLTEERGLSKASMRAYNYALGVLQSYLDRIGTGTRTTLKWPFLAAS